MVVLSRGLRAREAAIFTITDSNTSICLDYTFVPLSNLWGCGVIGSTVVSTGRGSIPLSSTIN